MTVSIKMCGLSAPQDVTAAVAAGAKFIGFVFFPKSPRNLTPAAARDLALTVPPGIAKVALTVDADDATLDEIVNTVPLDFLQLQGAETPERVVEVKARYGLPVIKAVGVATSQDLPALDTYGSVADMLLVDAKPPKGASRPGGNGLAFDWTLIAQRRWPVPWMLAGGLNPDNVARAVEMTGTRHVDVSSGIESEPGKKDPERIAAFGAALSAL